MLYKLCKPFIQGQSENPLSGLAVPISYGAGQEVQEKVLHFSSWIILLVLTAILTLAGCAAKKIDLTQELARKVEYNKHPKSIAILPFDNQTEVDGIDDFVRVTFYSHLSALPYEDIELHIVDKTLVEHRISSYKKLRKTRIKKLGRILECDAVVFGEVTKFERIFAGIYSQLAVGLSIKIWDTRTGRMIWSDENIERSHEGGLPLTLTDIPLITLKAGLNLRDTIKIRAVDELSRYLTGRVPVPRFTPYGDVLIGSWHAVVSTRFQSLKKLTKGKANRVEKLAVTSLKKLTKANRKAVNPKYSKK
jgi:hypothetical protein